MASSPPGWLIDAALGGLTLLAMLMAFVFARLIRSPPPSLDELKKNKTSSTKSISDLSKTTDALLKSSGVASTMSLCVIKTTATNLPKLRAFYSMILDVPFVHEQHGTGPKHFSATLPGGLVFEIYPLPKPKVAASSTASASASPSSPTSPSAIPAPTVPDATTRLGFRVRNLDSLCDRLAEEEDEAKRDADDTNDSKDSAHLHDDEWHGGVVISRARVMDYGRIAIVRDIDGRMIELTDIDYTNPNLPAPTPVTSSAATSGSESSPLLKRD